MKTKTQDLTGAALDWAVAKCEVGKPVGSFLDGVVAHPDYNTFHPSTDWAQGGPIIERELIDLRHIRTLPTMFWEAYAPAPEQDEGEVTQQGPTPLSAAMRCYVASKLGDEVEIPEGLA